MNVRNSSRELVLLTEQAPQESVLALVKLLKVPNPEFHEKYVNGLQKNV